jgi:chromosome segregation ATPase
MADENPSEFRFDGDEHDPESFYREELKDLRVEKLAQRLTVLTILLPCLLAVAIYFGYQDLSGRVSQSSDTGSAEIQQLTEQLEALSKDFNEKLITFSTTLSTQDKDFGTSIEGRLFAINKNIDELQGRFNALGAEIKRNKAQSQETLEKLNASKVDKKSQAKAIEKLNASIEPLKTELEKLKTIRQDLNAVSGDIKKLEAGLTQKLKAVAVQTEQVAEEYKELDASVTKLSGNTIDRDTLALEIFKLKKNFQNLLSKEISDLKQRLDSIRTENDMIENSAKTQKHSLKKASKKPALQASGSTPASGTGNAKPGPPSETITEKDLIE